jgi:hypothetical protein
MLRPCGMLLRQGASGSRKREQAPALHRIAAGLPSCGNSLLRVGVRACGVGDDWDVVVAQERMGAAVDKF